MDQILYTIFRGGGNTNYHVVFSHVAVGDLTARSLKTNLPTESSPLTSISILTVATVVGGAKTDRLVTVHDGRLGCRYFMNVQVVDAANAQLF